MKGSSSSNSNTRDDDIKKIYEGKTLEQLAIQIYTLHYQIKEKNKQITELMSENARSNKRSRLDLD